MPKHRLFSADSVAGAFPRSATKPGPQFSGPYVRKRGSALPYFRAGAATPGFRRMVHGRGGYLRYRTFGVCLVTVKLAAAMALRPRRYCRRQCPRNLAKSILSLAVFGAALSSSRRRWFGGRSEPGFPAGKNARSGSDSALSGVVSSVEPCRRKARAHADLGFRRAPAVCGVCDTQVDFFLHRTGRHGCAIMRFVENSFNPVGSTTAGAVGTAFPWGAPIFPGRSGASEGFRGVLGSAVRPL